MTSPDATSQAKTDAAKITKVDHSPGKGDGAEGAYHALLNDYTSYQKGKGHTAADDKTYWTQVTGDLTQSKVLPDISVAWGHDQLTGNHGGETSLGQVIDSQGKGTITQRELNTFAYYNSRPGDSDPNDAANATFASSLGGQFNSLKNISGFDGTNLSGSNLETQESHLNQYYQTYVNNDKARTTQAPLFADNGALIRSLDSAANPGGTLDGQVGHNDLQSWLATYNTVTENGQNPQAAGKGVFTSANKQFVQDMLNGKYNNSNDGLNSNGFKVSDLGQAGGFSSDSSWNGDKSYNDAVKSYSGANTNYDKIFGTSSSNGDTSNPNDQAAATTRANLSATSNYFSQYRGDNSGTGAAAKDEKNIESSVYGDLSNASKASTNGEGWYDVAGKLLGVKPGDSKAQALGNYMVQKFGSGPSFDQSLNSTQLDELAQHDPTLAAIIQKDEASSAAAAGRDA